jgi:hypothetical protein
MQRTLLWLLPTLVLGACSAPPPPTMTGQQRADAALRSACREHADAVYDRNNRDTIYRISTTNTPYSGQYPANSIDAGLAQRYQHDNLIRDCIRNTGTETDRTEPGPNATPQP